MGVNDSYSHLRAQILLSDSLPSINKVFPLILQEEHQPSLNIPKSRVLDSTALISPKNPTDVQKNASRSKFTSQKSRPICSHCGMTHHIKEKCYKLLDYPPGYKNMKPRIDFVDGNLFGNITQDVTISEFPLLPFTQ